MAQPTVRDLHNMAMNIAEYADLFRHNNWRSGLLDLYGAAYMFELKAAELLIERASSENTTGEPSRSILLKSAVWLAWNSERWLEAIRLAKQCLAGNPDNVIRAEMEDCIAKCETALKLDGYHQIDNGWTITE